MTRGLYLTFQSLKEALIQMTYIDWLNAIEKVFEFKGYLDEKKWKVAILKFIDYASL